MPAGALVVKPERRVVIRHQRYVSAYTVGPAIHPDDQLENLCGIFTGKKKDYSADNGKQVYQTTATAPSISTLKDADNNYMRES
jgi:hypothetical protein